jgi:hypothetical protein
MYDIIFLLIDNNMMSKEMNNNVNDNSNVNKQKSLLAKALSTIVTYIGGALPTGDVNISAVSGGSNWFVTACVFGGMKACVDFCASAAKSFISWKNNSENEEIEASPTC